MRIELTKINLSVVLSSKKNNFSYSISHILNFPRLSNSERLAGKLLTLEFAHHQVQDFLWEPYHSGARALECPIFEYLGWTIWHISTRAEDI
jgi:hypothetical protein